MISDKRISDTSYIQNESRSAEIKRAESRNAESRSVVMKHVESGSAESISAVMKRVESRSAESRTVVMKHGQQVLRQRLLSREMLSRGVR